MSMNKQRGNTLLMVLVVMCSLLIASVALFKSTSVTTIMAGNIAFRTAATSAGDIGLNNAAINMAALANLDTTVSNSYYATMQPLDAYGIPSTVNWNSVPSVSIPNFTIQQVIERLCVGPLPVADVTTQCNYLLSKADSSSKISSAQFTNSVIFYRVTIRVVGPKNTLSYQQAIFSY